MNNIVKQYCNNCKKLFPFSSKKEKDFFNRFEKDVNNFLIEHENTVYNDLILHFGSPKEVMTSYIEDLDEEYIIHHMNIKNLVKKISIILCTIIIIGLSIIVWSEYRTIKEVQNQQIIIEETVITEE